MQKFHAAPAGLAEPRAHYPGHLVSPSAVWLCYTAAVTEQKAVPEAEDPKCLLDSLAVVFQMENTVFMEIMQVKS